MEDEIRAEFKSLYITSKLKRWLIAQTTAVPASLKYAPQTLDFVFGPQKWPEDYIIAGGGMLGLRPSHFYATSSDIVAIEKDLGEIEARYGEIRMPAAMMFGTADRVLDHKRHGLPMRDKIAGLDFDVARGAGPHAAVHGQGTRRGGDRTDRREGFGLTLGGPAKDSSSVAPSPFVAVKGAPDSCVPFELEGIARPGLADPGDPS